MKTVEGNRLVLVTMSRVYFEEQERSRQVSQDMILNTPQQRAWGGEVEQSDVPAGGCTDGGPRPV